jgi:hypothetical protein
MVHNPIHYITKNLNLFVFDLCKQDILFGRLLSKQEKERSLVLGKPQPTY